MHPTEVGRMTLDDFDMCIGLIEQLKSGGGGGG